MKRVFHRLEALSKKPCIHQRDHVIKCHHQCKKVIQNHNILTSKEIRKLFLDYFVQEKNHTYVHSSPIFLNNDPTLLFVNAGMNQFRSLLLNKTLPGHPFHNMKRAANSQKCIRLSGKHNDLADVGQDLHHHTFFEMLGNWSFGDYSKKEACGMAWELLTKIYHIQPERLYVTYFGGDKALNLSPDEECRNIWLEIGVHPDHIFPFGAKDNFWEMGDKGPCGPCTEIHYDYLPSNDLPAIKRINADRSDLIEVWNLVFVQYNRSKDDILQSIPNLNVDTGMGFERLTAVLQGSMSNYDTDIFQPLFQVIEKNFKVKPYEGKTGPSDIDGLDTAYRVLADHSRMFTVAIADGLFPDNYDAGHILRKIMRRAAYAANRVMKSRPGLLSSIVPHVAESLSFFPEVQENMNEVIQIVNEEEKLFHQLINRGRKARNKMLSDSSSRVLTGQKFWELHHNYGLEENVVQDLASEINLTIDWDSYKKFSEEKKQLTYSRILKETSSPFEVPVKILCDKGIPQTNDSYKYNYCSEESNYNVENITAQVVAIFKDGTLPDKVLCGDSCTIVTDKTNFYSIAGGQEADVGEMLSKDSAVTVNKVHSHLGYTFHKGIVSKGEVILNSLVEMCVNKDHRIGCSRNHTATHILISALMKLFPYTSQRSSFVGPQCLKLGFSSKVAVTEEHIEEIEDFVNGVISKNLKVLQSEMPFETMLNMPSATLLRGEEYPDIVKVISIRNENGNVVAVEPCCGTHVHSTADLLNFKVMPYKSQGGTTRVLNCVTGKQAIAVTENENALWEKILQIQSDVDTALENISINRDDTQHLLKEVKQFLHACHLKTDVSFRMQSKCEKILFDLKLKLNDVVSSIDEESQVNEFQTKTKLNINLSKLITFLQSSNVSKTDDNYKYSHLEGKVQCVKPIPAKIIAVFQNEKPIEEVVRGQQCQVITESTNFYAEGDDQACDKGVIMGKDFVLLVTNVYKIEGYVVHDGWVETGNVSAGSEVKLLIDESNRLACSQNHTALHLLNSVLKKILPYAFQRSAFVEPSLLHLRFSSKISLSEEQLDNIESQMNKIIQEKLQVVKSQAPISQLEAVSPYKASLLKEFNDNVPIVSIGNNSSSIASLEPCIGTHVLSTSDIDQFILTTYKSSKNNERLIQAVTGTAAAVVKHDGKAYHEQMVELEDRVSQCLKREKVDYLELCDCLKEVKLAKAKHETPLPLLVFRNHQNVLSELSEQLHTATHSFVQEGFTKVKREMQSVVENNSQYPFIVHKLASIGDGKKIVNFALESVQDKPAMFFAHDGHKNVICSCNVPQKNLSSSFSALLWIQPLAEVIEGHTRSTAKNPELHYSVSSNRIDKIDEAVEIAEKFAKLYL